VGAFAQRTEVKATHREVSSVKREAIEFGYGHPGGSVPSMTAARDMPDDGGHEGPRHRSKSQANEWFNLMLIGEPNRNESDLRFVLSRQAPAEVSQVVHAQSARHFMRSFAARREEPAQRPLLSFSLKTLSSKKTGIGTS
jgi:hypothetical protein